MGHRGRCRERSTSFAGARCFSLGTRIRTPSLLTTWTWTRGCSLRGGNSSRAPHPCVCLRSRFIKRYVDTDTWVNGHAFFFFRFLHTCISVCISDAYFGYSVWCSSFFLDVSKHGSSFSPHTCSPALVSPLASPLASRPFLSPLHLSSASKGGEGGEGGQQRLKQQAVHVVFELRLYMIFLFCC